MISSKIAIKIRSSKSHHDLRLGILAAEFDDGWIAAPGVQSDQQIIMLIVIGLKN